MVNALCPSILSGMQLFSLHHKSVQNVAVCTLVLGAYYLRSYNMLSIKRFGSVMMNKGCKKHQ